MEKRFILGVTRAIVGIRSGQVAENSVALYDNFPVPAISRSRSRVEEDTAARSRFASREDLLLLPPGRS